ncbi:MAG: DUF6941 family protein [Longimicrobiales bacterium]
MHLILSTLCEAATVRPDGRLNLVGCFHELRAPGFPAAQDHLTVVFVIEWTADEVGRQPLRADLVDADGMRILTIEGHTEVVPAAGDAAARTRLIMPLENIVFPHAGRYRFDITLGKDVRRGCSLHVAHAGTGPDPS